jgi:hypothetical protein
MRGQQWFTQSDGGGLAFRTLNAEQEDLRWPQTGERVASAPVYAIGRPRRLAGNRFGANPAVDRSARHPHLTSRSH